MNHSHLPTIAISIGDPAGIGPEVSLKALSDPQVRSLAHWIIVGDGPILRDQAQQCGFSPDLFVDDPADIPPRESVVVWDTQQLTNGPVTMGQVDAACGRAAIGYVRLATELCLSQRADAIVTAPLSKEAVALTGMKFCGHTEYIADLCGVKESRMLLVNDQLSVVHVSTHCSLADATRISRHRVLQTIRLGHAAYMALRQSEPRIGVCGMNPHAGENGMFGDEEILTISPAIGTAQNEGIHCEGPYPADTLFMQAVRGKYDLLIAMYHDQGHVPMKLLDFEHTVNVTLGLPIIRTSVDHGTAFDIAGKNLADPSDMKTALSFAISMTQKKFTLATVS
jgi:4-hydroxythreonine-4-phosphate dehydrogenase